MPIGVHANSSVMKAICLHGYFDVYGVECKICCIFVSSNNNSLYFKRHWLWSARTSCKVCWKLKRWINLAYHMVSNLVYIDVIYMLM